MITLPNEIEEQMIAHARSLFPIECCGYLAGTIEGDSVQVKSIYEMTNLDQREDHFTFDPKEQFQAVKKARQEGLSLISVVHSHPETPARLSQEDILLFNDPTPVYIIVSLKDETPDLKGFTVNKPDEHTIEIKKVNLTYKKEGE